MLGGRVEIPSCLRSKSIVSKPSARNEVKGSTALAVDLEEALTIKALGAWPRRSLPQIGRARRKAARALTSQRGRAAGNEEGLESTPTHPGTQQGR